MGRVIPVALIALLLVAGGLWQASIRSADSASSSTATAQGAPDVEAPEGYRALEPLSQERQLSFDEADPVLEEGLDYRAVLETSKGQMIIDLLEEEAPVTVNNFVFLALHHYYDGVPFHRVLEDFMAQTGDPTGTGSGGPGYTFDNEINAELSHDSRGVVSMANAGPDTNGSQFFITFGPTPWLDGDYSIFGQVVEGQEVLSELQRIDPNNPSAVLRFDGTLDELQQQGVSLDGPGERTLNEHLEEQLGTAPAVGQTFTIGNYTAVVGRVGGVPAAGFFPIPDTLDDVTIIVSDEAQEQEE